jgi:hypothetical protein
MFGYYYNKSLRRIVVGFGSLFSGIVVEHENSTGQPTKIQVPVTYASQEKFIQRLLYPSSITDGTRIETQLPRISFQLNSIAPDPSRRRARINPTRTQVGGNCSSINEIATEAPVNLSLNLFAYTRHIDDMMQIFEQILPIFIPDHVIKMKLTDTSPELTIPIVMVSNSITDRYEGDFNSRRLHVGSFNFIAKSYLFGKQTSNITTINANSDLEIEFD